MSQEVIAICALFVSVFSVCLGAWTAFVQRKHMRLSVKPIATIPVADYENRVGVFLQNKGLGPMRVVSLKVANHDKKVHDNIKSHMPALEGDIIWSNFYDSVDGAFLEPGKRFELLLLEGNMNSEEYNNSRDKVRKILCGLTIEIEYEDLYGKRMEPLKENLNFFGRHFVYEDAEQS